MSFTPVVLYGPAADYFSLPKGDKNQSCIGFASLNASPVGLIPSAVNCAGDDEYPHLYFGNAAAKARLYASDNDPLAGYNFPLLAAKKLVTIGDAALTEWAMNGDLMAGCEAAATTPCVPDYALHFHGDTGMCGVAEDDYRKIADYWHDDVHKSYLDCFRIHDGDESDRVPLRSYTYDTMDVPSYRTAFTDILDYYETVWRSAGSAASGYRPMLIVQASTSATFASGVLESEPQEMADTDGTCEGMVGYRLRASVTWYFRAKRRDELIADPTTYTDTAWSASFSVTPRSRTDAVKLNGSAAAVPYYCSIDYIAANEQHRWSVVVAPKAEQENQDADLVRVQVASDSGFSTVVDDDTYTTLWLSDGESTAGASFQEDLTAGTVYYARCRYETADGETVGPWSNVFAMDGGADGANHVNRANFDFYTGTVVTETHWTGDRVAYYLRSNPLAKDGHIYAVLGRNRQHNEAGTLTDFGALYLADYTASTVTLSLIVDEIADWDTMLSAIYGTPPHTDLVEVGDKLYADCTTPDSDFYDWCDVTGGVVGTISHITYPAGVTSHLWVTIGNIHGAAMAVASLDTGSAFVLGVAPLTGDTAMTPVPAIRTGYTFVKDPWLNSLWYDASNYAGTETAICWLGMAQKNNSIFFQEG